MDKANFNQNQLLAKEATAMPTGNPSLEAQSREIPAGATLAPPGVSLLAKDSKNDSRRIGDMTVYKYYIQTVHYLNAVFFAAICLIFVLGLTLPSK